MGRLKKKIKSGASKVKKTAGWARKELSDRRILDLAAAPYAKVKTQLKKAKSQLEGIDLDQRIAMQVGEQILNRAQNVRKTLKRNKIRTDEKN